MIQPNGNELPIMELPEGILGHVATILHEPSEILSLALTCQGLRNACEGVAQTFFDGATDKERSNLPQGKLPTTRDLFVPGRSCSFANWGLISKYQQILKHREGLKFDQILGDVKYSDPNDMSKITSSGGHGFGVSNRIIIMRSGVHRATFEFSGEGMVELGVARPMDYKRIALHRNQYTYPSAEVITEKYPSAWRDEISINVVLLINNGDNGLCKGLTTAYSRNQNVGFRFGINEKIGLVLNLDAGILSMFKNGSYVGELCSGLEGEYVWVGQALDRISMRISDWE